MPLLISNQHKKVLIQSDDTSVLSKFHNVTAYQRLFYLRKEIGDAPAKSIEEIKKFANAINVPKQSIVPIHLGLAKAATQLQTNYKRPIL